MEYSKTDMVVLGTGGAGMTAAITAAEAGAKVVVLEKRPFPGGASNTPVGFGFVKNDPELQDKAFRSHMDRTRWTANADLVRNYCLTSWEVPEMLAKTNAPMTVRTEGPAFSASGGQPGGSGNLPVVQPTGMCQLQAVGQGHGGAQMIKAMVRI